MLEQAWVDRLPGIPPEEIWPAPIGQWEKIELPLIITPEFLSSLYSQLTAKGSRKKRGAFYTPTSLAGHLAERLIFYLKQRGTQAGSAAFTFLDPACGGGDLLVAAFKVLKGLGLSDEEILLERLIGMDCDPLATFLCRYALWNTCPEVGIIPPQIHHLDSLHDPWPPRIEHVDAVISNPPWTTRLDKVARKKYSAFRLASGEFCLSSLFIEKTLTEVAPQTVCGFLIPDSLSKIKSHRPMREYLLQNAHIREYNPLGDPFKEVFAPCASLFFTKDDNHGQLEINVAKNSSRPVVVSGTEVPLGNFTLGEELFFNVNYNSTIELFLERAADHGASLKELDSTYFLGVVTGDNKRHITKRPTTQSHEPIISGPDINPFHIKPAQYYINFQPDQYQQVCPPAYFRRQKLVYRFICDRLVFAAELEGRVMLNNANGILINNPEIGLDLLAGLLNSDVVNALYRYRFRTVRVLQKNLNSLPLLLPEETFRTRWATLAQSLRTLRQKGPSKDRLTKRSTGSAPRQVSPKLAGEAGELLNQLNLDIFHYYRKKTGVNVTPKDLGRFLKYDPLDKKQTGPAGAQSA